MPKGLVVYLDDDLHDRLRAVCAHEKKTLKDFAYEQIKGALEFYEENLLAVSEG